MPDAQLQVHITAIKVHITAIQVHITAIQVHITAIQVPCHCCIHWASMALVSILTLKVFLVYKKCVDPFIIRSLGHIQPDYLALYILIITHFDKFELNVEAKL